MKKSLGIAFVPLVAASVLAACNNSGTGTSFTNPPTCGVPGTTVLAFPKNGAAKAPAGLTSVYIVSSVNYLNNGNYNSAIQPPNGLPYYYGNSWAQIPESQVPKPHASPGFSNPTWYSSYIGGLQSGSTYVVGFNVVNQICNPAGLGSFTTQ